MVAPNPVPQQNPQNPAKKSIFVETASHWMDDNAQRLSAALSLYTILSLAPLLVITAKIVALVWRSKEQSRQLISQQLSNLMGSQAADAIKPMLDSGAQHGKGVLATVISLVVLLISAAGVFGELQADMNTIWGIKPKPHQGAWGLVRQRLLSMSMVFGIAFMLLVSMFVSTVLAAFAKRMAGDSKVISFAADVVVSYGVVVVLFAMIFKILPDAKILWRHVWMGALITGALFTVGKYGLAIYFKFATPTSAFGAAGSLVAVLLWVYYSAFILFFGAEFTKVWALRHGHAIVPNEYAQKVDEEQNLPPRMQEQVSRQPG